MLAKAKVVVAVSRRRTRLNSEDANGYQSSGVLVAFVLAYHEAGSGSTLNFSLRGGWYGIEVTEPSPAIGYKMR